MQDLWIYVVGVFSQWIGYVGGSVLATAIALIERKKTLSWKFYASFLLGVAIASPYPLWRKQREEIRTLSVQRDAAVVAREASDAGRERAVADAADDASARRAEKMRLFRDGLSDRLFECDSLVHEMNTQALQAIMWSARTAKFLKVASPDRSYLARYRSLEEPNPSMISFWTTGEMQEYLRARRRVLIQFIEELPPSASYQRR